MDEEWSVRELDDEVGEEEEDVICTPQSNAHISPQTPSPSPSQFEISTRESTSPTMQVPSTTAQIVSTDSSAQTSQTSSQPLSTASSARTSQQSPHTLPTVPAVQANQSPPPPARQHTSAVPRKRRIDTMIEKLSQSMDCSQIDSTSMMLMMFQQQADAQAAQREESRQMLQMMVQLATAQQQQFSMLISTLGSRKPE
eukprot:c1108_g1_i1.p1 GENE.c1108_g1_i1~~c1108_g1_i1.p1  ORF type:complete len:198 (+),score=48.40 c1108_g1_i1:92-685(+)